MGKDDYPTKTGRLTIENSAKNSNFYWHENHTGYVRIVSLIYKISDLIVVQNDFCGKVKFSLSGVWCELARLVRLCSVSLLKLTTGFSEASAA